ncbi:MAG: transporter substrate-binding domain-containing protein [Legionellales bacterium]|nr:transporter substrate-binding domain-containing protein [Legionellales bacterium]
MKFVLSILFSMFAVSASAAQVLTFAAEATYPPFVNIDERNQVAGFETAVIQAMCQHLSVECKFSHHPWESLIVGVKLGKFDGVYGGMEITEQRQKIVAFTQPIYHNQIGLLVNQTKISEFTPDALNHQTIGVQRGTTFERYLREEHPKRVKVKNFTTIQEALLDLKTGRVSGVLGDVPVLTQWLARQPSNDLYQLLELPQQELVFFGKGYGIAVKQGNQQLLKQLNQALLDIKNDGTYDTLYQQYFN